MVLKMILTLTGLNVLIAVIFYFVCWKWGYKLKFRKPLLIDQLVALEEMNQTQSEHDGRWYVAKPMEFSNLWALVTRVNHAYLILIGKAQAFQYQIDRISKVKR